MQEAIWEDLPQVLWRTGYSSLDLMKLLLITGPPCFKLVCCFSSGWWVAFPCKIRLTSLTALRLTFTLGCKSWQGHVVWYSWMSDSMFMSFKYQEVYFNIIEGFIAITRKPQMQLLESATSKPSMIYSVCSFTSTFCICVHLSFSYSHNWTLSPPTGVRLLYKAAWMGTEITEGCLGSWFPSHFEVSSAHRTRAHGARLVWGL